MQGLSSNISDWSIVTPAISLGTKYIGPGKQLRIRNRWLGKFGGLFITLSEPGESMAFEFTLNWLTSIGQLQYVILTYPSWVTADDDVQPRMALKVIAGGHLATLSREEFEASKRQFMEIVQNSPQCTVESATSALGVFRPKS